MNYKNSSQAGKKNSMSKNKNANESKVLVTIIHNTCRSCYLMIHD